MALHRYMHWIRGIAGIAGIVLLIGVSACGLNEPRVATEVVAPPTVPTNTLAPIITTTPRFTATPIPTSTLIPTATLPPTATEAPPTSTLPPTPLPIVQIRGSVTTSTRTVNLRAGPGTDFRAVMSVPGGAGLTVIGANPDRDWYFVVLEDGAEGWMASEFVTISNATALAVLSTADLTRRADDPAAVAPASTPVATLPPRTARNTDVLAYCDLDDFRGRYAGRSFNTSTPVTIFWSWYARTPEQIQDHLDYSRYAVTVDRLEGETWRPFRALEDYRNYQTGVTRVGNSYYVYWYVPIGTLEAGQYRINYRVTWTQRIEDGEQSFGPGGDDELNVGSCLFAVR